jgi:hypothetical protein
MTTWLDVRVRIESVTACMACLVYQSAQGEGPMVGASQACEALFGVQQYPSVPPRSRGASALRSIARRRQKPHESVQTSVPLALGHSELGGGGVPSLTGYCREVALHVLRWSLPFDHCLSKTECVSVRRVPWGPSLTQWLRRPALLT